MSYFERHDVICMPSGPSLVVHHPEECAGQACCIHRPSGHHMRDWPQVWRWDLGVMERTCPHGVGHPDPDDLAYRRRRFGSCDGLDLHGCDGCCLTPMAGGVEL